jgi:hypothetical protein
MGSLGAAQLKHNGRISINSVGFRSAILTIFQFWQNGTFELEHEIQKLFWPNDFF